MSRLISAFTACRFLLAVGAAWSLWEGGGTITLLLLTGFICADLADGVVARILEVDTAERRAIDSITDRTSVLVCFSVAVLMDGRFGLILLAFLMGTAACISRAWSLWRRRIVLKAPTWHRVWSLLAATTGAAFALELTAVWMVLGLAFISMFVVCSWDLRRTQVEMLLVTPSGASSDRMVPSQRELVQL